MPFGGGGDLGRDRPVRDDDVREHGADEHAAQVPQEAARHMRPVRVDLYRHGAYSYGLYSYGADEQAAAGPTGGSAGGPRRPVTSG